MSEEQNQQTVKSETENYEHYIVLDKSELMSLARLSDVLTQVAMDDYGKSFYFKCEGDSVVVTYANRPYYLQSRLGNASKSTVSDFFVSIPLLRKVLSSCGNNLTIVEKEGRDGDSVFYFEILGGLLYLETQKSLLKDAYDIVFPETTSPLNMSIAKMCFRDLLSVVSLSERTSEKVVVIKDGNAFFNTSFFSAKTQSPFTGGEEFVLFKIVSSLIATFTEVCDSLTYTISNNTLILKGGIFQCSIPIGLKVSDFYSPVVETVLNFNASAKLDSIYLTSLVSLVNRLDYLCDIINLKFKSDSLQVCVYSKSFDNKSTYTYPYLEGSMSSQGSIDISSGVLKTVLSFLTDATKYCFHSDYGLCVDTHDCKFVVRPIAQAH